VPRFAHVPLVLGPDGARLAKRHGGIGVRQLRERGVARARLVRWLAESLGLEAAEEARALVTRFALARIRKGATIVDPAQL
jgi:glutamyl-tRNA synthetase